MMSLYEVILLLLFCCGSGLKPIIGGAVCGLAGIFVPQILFFGYETLDGLIANQEYPITALLTLLFLKAVMTAFCLGSGLTGGLFAPSLFLGATAGASYQKIINGKLKDRLSSFHRQLAHKMTF